MRKIVIIGGGASGLICAINAANEEDEVIILEKNNTCAKKILVTGNGKCNYWNEDQDIEHYNSSNILRMEEIIETCSKEEVLNFFDKIGIIPKIKNGYYYPFSNQAISMKTSLLKEAEKKNIKIINDIEVFKILKEDNKFIIKTSESDIEADVVVLATGSKASIKNSEEYNGYKILKNLGHDIIKPLPGLVQLVTKNIIEGCSGVRTDVKVSLYENEKLIKIELGELQITDYGISGICSMQLSSIISRGLNEEKDEVVKINFLPFINKDDFITFINERNNKMADRNIADLFEGFLNYKIINHILKKSNIDNNELWDNINEFKKEKLKENLFTYQLNVLATKPFENAQICIGGLSLAEITNNFESTIINNLYVIGELLDVNGDCGGYNLSFAWLSGMKCGLVIKEGENDKN